MVEAGEVRDSMVMHMGSRNRLVLVVRTSSRRKSLDAIAHGSARVLSLGASRCAKGD